MNPRPLAHFLRLFTGPVVWFVHFIVLYGAEALICSPAVTTANVMIWIAAAATVVALGGIALFAGREIGRPLPDRGLAEHTAAAFLRAATLMLTLVSALGVVWTALPVALLPVCASPGG